MIVRALLYALTGAAAGAAVGQAPPSFAPSGPSPDARIKRIDYVPGQVTAVEVTPGYQLTIGLAPDERIATVALGNTAAFQVTASRAGDAMFVKALQSGVATNMTVVTDVRRYSFALSSGRGEPTAYSIEFQYPRPLPAVIGPVSLVGTYKLDGAKPLWPLRISDDGVHVFIDWADGVDLPAIYALDAQGHESLINGMMRGSHMVIDGIAPRLLFRLDRAVASASRRVEKPKRP